MPQDWVLVWGFNDLSCHNIEIIIFTIDPHVMVTQNKTPLNKNPGRLALITRRAGMRFADSGAGSSSQGLIPLLGLGLRFFLFKGLFRV